MIVVHVSPILSSIYKQYMNPDNSTASLYKSSSSVLEGLRRFNNRLCDISVFCEENEIVTPHVYSCS